MNGLVPNNVLERILSTQFSRRDQARRAQAQGVARRSNVREFSPRRWSMPDQFCDQRLLGFAPRSTLDHAARQSLTTTGVGAGASPLVSGYSLALADLEQRIARWQGTEASLVFSSGLAMNIGVIAALVGADDLVLSDRLNHASLIDGCRLSGAHKRIYGHGNVDEVRDILRRERTRYQRALLVTESLFSMDGSRAAEGTAGCVRPVRCGAARR